MHERITNKLEAFFLKILPLMGKLAFVTLGLVVIVGFFIPIYTDEVSYKMIFSRYFLDQAERFTLMPQCGPTMVGPLWFSMPFRVFESLLFGHLSSLILIRIFGVLSFCVIFYLFVLSNFKNRSWGAWITAAALSVGVLPLLLVINRPEQQLLLAFFGLLVLFRYKGASNLKEWFKNAAFIFCMILAFSYHVKTILFLPFLLVGGWLISDHLVSKLFRVLVLLMATASAYLYGFKSAACVQAPILSQLLAQTFVVPSELFRHPHLFIRSGIQNLHNGAYFTSVLFNPEYMSSLLPGLTEHPKSLATANYLLNALLNGSFIFTLISVLRWLMSGEIKKRYHGEMVVALSLLASLFAISFLQTIKNLYESILILPIYIGAIMLIAQTWECSIRNSIRVRVIGMFGLFFVFGVGMVSNVVALRSYAPHVFREWTNGGGVPTQPYSVSGFHAESVRADIIHTSESCGIRPEDENLHLIVDDLTYTVFWKARAPYHSVYLWGFWGQDIHSNAFFAEHHSAGAILQCRALPDDLKAKAVVFHSDQLGREDLCCLKKF